MSDAEGVAKVETECRMVGIEGLFAARRREKEQGRVGLLSLGEAFDDILF
jgi:hypothetical protein